MSETRKAVEGLLAKGLKPSEIARELELAPPTVSYHVARIKLGAVDERRRSTQVVEIDESIRRRPTRDAVRELVAQGLRRSEISRALGLSKATVSYHARRLGLEIDDRCARRYDWKSIQRHHDAGHSRVECIERFGLSRSTWYDAVKRGDLRARPGHTPLEDLLVDGVYRSRHNLKLRLLGAGIKAPRCERCGLAAWRGRPLSLALHHVNGDRLDNRLENLELLCPNCHSQTENFAGRSERRSGRAGGRRSRAARGGPRIWHGGARRRPWQPRRGVLGRPRRTGVLAA